MAASGDMIENPQIGERVVFRITTEESAGELLQFDFFLSKGARQPSSHRHMEQESRFEVTAGSSAPVSAVVALASSAPERR